MRPSIHKARMGLSTRAGFSLIEILVVVSILSLLVSIVFASLNVIRAKSRDAQRLNDIARIQTALELYHDDYGRYPDGQADTKLGTDDDYPCPQLFYVDWSLVDSSVGHTPCPLHSHPPGISHPGNGFLPELVPYLGGSLIDPTNSFAGGYYYTYTRVDPSIFIGGNTCTDPTRIVYILKINKFETSNMQTNPNFCNIFPVAGYVTGKFEN